MLRFAAGKDLESTVAVFDSGTWQSTVESGSRIGLRFVPQRDQIDRLLDDELFALVRGNLGQCHPTTTSRGPPSTTVEIILHMLVVMRFYCRRSYKPAEYFGNDSLAMPVLPCLSREGPDDITS